MKKYYTSILAVLSAMHGLQAMEGVQEKTANDRAYKAVENEIKLKKLERAIEEHDFTNNHRYSQANNETLAWIIFERVRGNHQNALEAFELILKKPKLPVAHDQINSFLVHAIGMPTTVALQKILENKALIHLDINKPIVEEMTPALWAVICQRLDMLKILVEHGADLFAQDKIGYNTLHRAIAYDSKDIAHYILQKQWKTSIAKNKNGENPIDLAISLKRSNDFLKMLQDELLKVKI